MGNAKRAEYPNDTDVAQLKLLSQVQEELTVNNRMSVILRGSRIIVPTSLQQRAMKLAHEGNLITKKFLREKVWFPLIDDKVKQMIDECITCQANGPENRLQPLQMSPLPPEPWHTVHVDFC